MTVAVIITARNAEATIGDAVRSALDQPEVSEVVVVDDASADATGAEAAARGDPRIAILRQELNIGPAAARNLAIARSTAPFIAILDADDYFLPGRFGQLFRHSGWDIIADNIVFVPDTAPLLDPEGLPQDDGGSETLDLEAFVRGNISQRHVQRGELGFLKPVIRRSVWPQDQPVYDPALWLGEDYDLYVRLLVNGARFRLTQHVGYVARVRAHSLSGRHRTSDLEALLAATGRHIMAAERGSAALKAMQTHRRKIRDRFVLRSFLDRKADGIGHALSYALSSPTNIWPIATGILRDKLAALRPPAKEDAPAQRILLPIQAPRSVVSAATSPSAQAPASSFASDDRS